MYTFAVMALAIKIEGVSKVYRLGEIGTGTLVSDIQRWYAKARGQEDPYQIIGETNDRTVKGESDIVWSLKNISFEVEQGEALGIIGRNGAGKSTLLKILSRVTSPTAGSVKLHGRIASLLEVGTGFHPDLTGRENVFLNGAILGMRKKEIARRFDEIVAFAAVERYIDTPVKHYSSGMYVRLAFAVASFLQSEILIIDEVLAVGDGEFQKKCIDKMNRVKKEEGKTILFVSHNLSAVSALTSTSILLNNGQLVAHASTSHIIDKYLESQRASTGPYQKEAHPTRPSFTRAELVTSGPGPEHPSGEPLQVHIEVNMPALVEGMGLSFQIISEAAVEVVYAYRFDVDTPLLRKTGINKLTCTIPHCRLYEGHYYLKLYLAESKGRVLFDSVEKICRFEVFTPDRMLEGKKKNLCVYLEDFTWHHE